MNRRGLCGEPAGRRISVVIETIMSTLVDRSEAPHSGKPVGQLGGIPFYNCCYTNFPQQDLVLADDDYAGDRTRAQTCICKDGVKPMTKDEQECERRLNWKVVKKFTMAIFTMDVTKFSFPIGYSEPRTFMERSTDLFAFLVSDYLERAFECTLPEGRLSMVAIGIIAGFHLYLQSKKPWNPVLGETYVGEWGDGTTLYGEQISHHPAITAIQIRTPTNHWRIDAQFCFGVSQGLLQVDVLQKGRTKLEFADHTIYEWEFPTIRAVGILKGDRIVRVEGSLTVKDLTNRLDAKIDTWPKNSKKLGIVHARATTIWGGIARPGQEGWLAVIHGDYCDTVYINDQVAWKLDGCFASRARVKIPDTDLMPSDARFRIDRALLIRGDLHGAEEAKCLLEMLQRRDAKLRKL
jgi:hypothetical protein